MSKPSGQLYYACAIVLLSLAAGCSSSKKNQTSSGVHFVTPSTSPTIDAGQSINVSISASDGSNVSWTLEAGFGTPKGTLSNKSGSGATYTAPASVGAETQVTIVATSGTDSAALAVFVMPAPQNPFWSDLQGNQATPMPSSCPANGTVLASSGNGPLFSSVTGIGFTQIGQTLSIGNLNLKEPKGVAPYAWSVDQGSLPDGLTLQVGTDTSLPSIVGAPITSGCSSFTVQVTDGVGVSATSQTLNIVVVPPSLKVDPPTVHWGLIDPSNQGISFTPVTMLASAGIPPYSWSLTLQGSGTTPLPLGLALTASKGQITGLPDPNDLNSSTSTTFGCCLGTAYLPGLVGSDSQTPYPAAAVSQLSTPIGTQDPTCPTGQESDLKSQGSYAFQLHGFDANGPVTISGNFVVDGTGNITGGTEDISRTTGTQAGLAILPGSGGGGSTYTLRNNRGCMTLATSAGTTPFRIAMGGCSTGRDDHGRDCQAPTSGAFYFTSGHMVEFDDTTGGGTRVSGIVRLQDPSTFQNSGINGMYAFGLSGWDASKARFAMAGSATSGSGSWSSVAADTNDAGALGTALTGGSGTFNVAADGRGTGTITVGSLSLNVVLYPVSSNEVMIATQGPASATNPLLTGEAIATSASFSSQSLQNSHIFHIAGISTQGPDPSIGTLAFDGAGGFTGVEYENQAGTLSTSNLSGGYSMDGSSGRFAFSATGTQSLGLHPLVGYVIPVPSNLSFPSCIVRAACVTGFLLSTDSTAQAGVLEFQTPSVGPPPPFSANNFVGDYVLGTDEPLDPKTSQISGAGTAGPPTIPVVQDTSYGDPKYCLLSSCTLLIPDDQATLSFSVNSDGSGKFGGQTVSVTNGATTFYVDESPLNLHPSVVVVEQ